MLLFVDHLTNVDFSYLCPNRGLVGETWLASIELEGPVDHQGMVCDFGIVKKQLRHWLDEQLDHKLIVPSQSANIQITGGEDACSLYWQFAGRDHLRITSPAQAYCLVPSQHIEPESLAIWCTQQLADAFGPQVQRLSLRFTPESITTPFYHYSHGLKKHAGNCQRIAHGHRSRLDIWRNGEYCLDSVSRIARQWQDIYLGTRSDIVQQTPSHTAFAYAASQGEFFLELPNRCLYLMDQDTTVENISEHLYQRLTQDSPRDHIRVKAFEGLGKGAITQST